jgi:hypothetical protein
MKRSIIATLALCAACVASLPLPAVAQFAPTKVHGSTADGAAASGVNPVVGGVEARALGAVPAAVHAGDVGRSLGSLLRIPYLSLTDPAGTVTPVGVPGTAIGGVIQPSVWDGAAARRLLGLASGVPFAALLDGAGNAITSAVAGATRPVDVQLRDSTGAALGQGAAPLAVAGAVTTELGTDNLQPGGGPDTQAIVGLALAKAGGHALVGAGAAGDPVPITDDGDSVTVDGAVDLELAGTAVSAGTGAPDAGTVRCVPAQPDGPSITSGLEVADQTVGPEDADIAANANRANLLVRMSGTTACMVSLGSSTGGGADGLPYVGGTVDDDGNGEWFRTESTEAVWIWDISGAGTCKFRYIEEVW